MLDEVGVPTQEPPQKSGSHPWSMRIGVVALLIALVVAVANQVGAVEARATASGGGVEATVTYAVVARRGESVPLKVSVRGIAGSEEPVTIWLRDSYLDDLEQLGWSPAPSNTLNKDGQVGVTFPSGSGVIDLEFDARLLPTTFVGNHELTMVIETEVGKLDFLLTTLVFP